jgi:hypothetical protein
MATTNFSGGVYPVLRKAIASGNNAISADRYMKVLDLMRVRHFRDSKGRLRASIGYRYDMHTDTAGEAKRVAYAFAVVSDRDLHKSNRIVAWNILLQRLVRVPLASFDVYKDGIILDWDRYLRDCDCEYYANPVIYRLREFLGWGKLGIIPTLELDIKLPELFRYIKNLRDAVAVAPAVFRV